MKLGRIFGVLGIGAVSILTGGLATPVLCGVVGGFSAILKLEEEESADLREALEKANIDNATKQKIITELNEKIQNLEEELKKETEKADKNEKEIKILKKQLDDLYEILKAAKAA